MTRILAMAAFFVAVTADNLTADIPRPWWENPPDRTKAIADRRAELAGLNTKQTRFELSSDATATRPVLVIPRSQLPEGARMSSLEGSMGIRFGATALASCACVCVWRPSLRRLCGVLLALGVLGLGAGSIAWATPPRGVQQNLAFLGLPTLDAEVRIVPQGDVIRLILPKSMLVEP